MAEVEKKQKKVKEQDEELVVEEPVEEEEVAEEKVHRTEVKLDMSAMTTIAEQIKALTEQVSVLSKRITENDEEKEQPPAEEEPKVEQPKEKPVDETKGEVVAEPEVEAEETSEGFVIEKADSGRGFQIWRDYSKDAGKFKRLSR